MNKRRDPNRESPPASAEMLARLQPLSEAPARLQTAIRRVRGAQRTPTKELISLRLDREVLRAYRRTGRGWQARMNTDLQKAARKLA